jgi:endogenous inhibitor of DNA gyrase (YacG/DUF329 family)
MNCLFCGNEISSTRELEGHEYCSQDCAYLDFMKAISVEDIEELDDDDLTGLDHNISI